MSAAQQFADALRAEDPETDHDDLMLALDSETDVFDVLRRLVRGALEDEGQAARVNVRMNELGERKARFTARAQAQRQTVIAMLLALERPKFPDAEFTLSVSPAKLKAKVCDLDALPESFVRLTRAPDQTLINAAASAGQVPPGCTLVSAPPSLTIRTK